MCLIINNPGLKPGVSISLTSWALAQNNLYKYDEINQDTQLISYISDR